MRKYTLLLAILGVFAIYLNPVNAQEEEVPGDEEATKSCIYVVDTPQSWRINCFGSGSFCTNTFECATILN